MYIIVILFVKLNNKMKVIGSGHWSYSLCRWLCRTPPQTIYSTVSRSVNLISIMQAESETNRSWLQDIPVTSLRFAIRELKERLRVCNSLVVYLDDISDVQAVFGKGLSKVCGILCSHCFQALIFLILDLDWKSAIRVKKRYLAHLLEYLGAFYPLVFEH